MGKWCTYAVLNAKKDTIRRKLIESHICLKCWYSPIMVITDYIVFPYEKTNAVKNFQGISFPFASRRMQIAVQYGIDEVTQSLP